MRNNASDATCPKDAQGFLGSVSPTMQMLEAVIVEIAPTEIPVLLVGESGAGKEMFAWRVHRLSSHCDEPLVKVACGLMTCGTFLAELGLNRYNEGHAAVGRTGTVFFNEISELDAVCQRSLLYSLPDGNANPRSGSLLARVISVTNRNLEEEMHSGRFRNELYYRINGVCLRLPPLRERKEDIPLLVESFLTKHAAQLSRPRPSLSPRILRKFMDHSWPGNIRELENVVKKIVALGDEEFAIEQLEAAPIKPDATEAPDGQSYSLKTAARAASREAERELIMRALTRTRWNRKRAAQELQISYKSLLHKLKQIGFEDSAAN